MSEIVTQPAKIAHPERALCGWQDIEILGSTKWLHQVLSCMRFFQFICVMSVSLPMTQGTLSQLVENVIINTITTTHHHVHVGKIMLLLELHNLQKTLTTVTFWAHDLTRSDVTQQHLQHWPDDLDNDDFTFTNNLCHSVSSSEDSSRHWAELT